MFGLSSHSEQDHTDLEHEMLHARVTLTRHLSADAEEADDPEFYSFADARENRRRLNETLGRRN